MENVVVLKVSDTSGKRIKMGVTREGSNVKLNVPFIEAVKKDKPAFAKKGIIDITVLVKDYTATKNMLTSYLENLFLKELSSADTDTSNGRRSNTGRAKTKPTTGSNEGTGGESSSSLRDSGRGDEPTESDREGSSDSDMAKSDDKKGS